MSSADPERLSDELARAVWSLNRALRQSQGTPRGENPRPIAQVEVLRLVDGRPGITVREVADSLRMQSANVSALLTRLVADGLVERRPHPGDGRVVQLHSTGKMQAASRELADRLDLGMSRAMNSLGAQARVRLAAALPDLQALAEALNRDLHAAEEVARPPK
ncbi:MarR family winged helix-turn-helix transcriptional regulator [Rhodococcoides fascians]|uniref:MarR family winged helix-turn-helix transcriptional regulator n=1 Tax=Rhodococcoides fascians TaxID=1828 RepID=UPI00068D3EC7|nr:MarR family transcriptional regulator [Rhodococcus fascians]